MKIEKGIDRPAKQVKAGDKWAFLADMEVGDSFIVTQNDVKNPQAAVGCCNRWAQNNTSGEWRFSQRTLPDGVRVWRIK